MHSVEFKDGKVIMLDQRKLPQKEEFIACTSVEETAEAIRNMIVRGAPAIGVAAAYGMIFATDLNEAAKTLKAARPTAVDLMNAVDYILAEHAKGTSAESAAKKWHQMILDKTKKICENGAGLIKDGSTVLLHCNTGPLATAAYGTALGAVIYSKQKKPFCYVDETRPRFQGALTSWELLQADVEHKVITDSMAGMLMKERKISCVMVGADRIVKNGDFANKIGTYSLAVLAKTHAVPFYVFAPLSTFDFKLENGDSITIEERNELEVLEVEGRRMYAAGTHAFNPAFDITPAKYVTEYVTEFGVYKKAKEIENYGRI
jgi:translation initiation factor eIF-2B subunit alpha/methylthioribose-1-phosphate isomerase